MIIQNIIDSWKHIPYTLRHYAAFLRTEKKYIGYYKYKFHDLDKAAWECNYEEAVIDWECCRLTKPQEPMSAREYLEYKKGTLRDVHYAHMDIIMKQFNL